MVTVPQLQKVQTARRAGAAALLVGFLAALLLGAFHPLGQVTAHPGHVCGTEAERHVEAERHHAHDPATCALCHLAREAAVVTAPPCLLPAAAFTSWAQPTGVQRRPSRATRRTAQPRAPPLTPAVAS